MEKEDFTNIDLFQARESMHGYSLGSILSKDPKDFQIILDKKINDSQKSLMDEMNDDCKKKLGINQSFNLLNKFMRDDYIFRKKKDVTLEIDFRSILQHTLFLDLKSYK